jgi:hypothetical protein
VSPTRPETPVLQKKTKKTGKPRKYDWDAGDLRRRGAWSLDVSEETFDAKCEFLRGDIYRRKDATIEARSLTVYERYSDRGSSAQASSAKPRCRATGRRLPNGPTSSEQCRLRRRRRVVLLS